MADNDWLSNLDFAQCVQYLLQHTSDRKQLLFDAACRRRVWNDLVDPRSRKAIEAYEDWADERISWTQLAKAIEGAKKATKTLRSKLKYDMPKQYVWRAAAMAQGARTILARSDLNALVPENEAEEADFRLYFRDVVRDPTGPAALVPSSFSQVAVRLAETIYLDRAFDRLPILADALEEAGCTNAEVLAHCRGPVPHVRGCWVVDLLLEKE
jgi:hypothetical protein